MFWFWFPNPLNFDILLYISNRQPMQTHSWYILEHDAFFILYIIWWIWCDDLDLDQVSLLPWIVEIGSNIFLDFFFSTIQKIKRVYHLFLLKKSKYIQLQHIHGLLNWDLCGDQHEYYKSRFYLHKWDLYLTSWKKPLIILLWYYIFEANVFLL